LGSSRLTPLDHLVVAGNISFCGVPQSGKFCFSAVLVVPAGYGLTSWIKNGLAALSRQKRKSAYIIQLWSIFTIQNEIMQVAENIS